MNVEEFKRVIVSQKEEIEEKFKKLRIINREIDIKKLKKYLNYPNILVIMGIRRCGKSILSLQILKNEKFGYINFDDERLSDISPSDLDNLLQAFYELFGTDLEFFILDEPQNIKGWELFVNRLRRTKKVIVTGSNSKLLSGELSTALTGRYVSFNLFPFSFREYLIYNKFNLKTTSFYSIKDISRIKKFLMDYIKIGGLPEGYLFGKEIIVRTYSDIIKKDVIKRLKVRKKRTLKELAKYLVTNSSKEITYRKLSNLFKIKDVHTVKNWIEGLENAYLIFILERYSPKLKQQILSPKKIYCIDTGIVNTIGFKFSESIGELMENLVAIELLRRKSYWNRDWEIYYWKDYQQREVDFLIKEGNRIKELIQVTYISDWEEINEREIKSLKKAYEIFKRDRPNLTVITWDYEDKREGIKFIPLWKWLLKI